MRYDTLLQDVRARPPLGERDMAGKTRRHAHPLRTDVAEGFISSNRKDLTFMGD